MATKDQYVTALVEAYYGYDEDRFRRTVLQIAAQAKNEAFKDRLLRRAEIVRPVLTSQQQGFVDSVAPVGRDELVFEKFLSENLLGVVREHRAHVELLVRGVPPRRRLLFEGEPGNGKTKAAAWLAGELNLTCFAVTLAKVVDSHLGQTAAHLAQIFPALSAGCCLVLDEIDALGATRGASDSGAMRDFNLTVNAFLTLMDRTEGGVLIATTNRAELLDPALLRRFDEVFKFPAPSEEASAELKERLAGRYQIQEFTEGELVDIEEAGSFAEIERICRKVARREAVAAHEKAAAE